MLKKLNELNNFHVSSVDSNSFNSYGKVIKDYDFSFLENYMKTNTKIPSEGNAYIPEDDFMSSQAIKEEISLNNYGEMPIQIGYCNGVNSTVNGFEYHKGSEIIFAVTDFVLCLGKSYDIKNNEYDVEDAEFFFIKAGTCIEIYQTTLHLSPIKVTDEGYKSIIILPLGTNTELRKKPKDPLLFKKNKWIIAHKDRYQLVDQGVYVGLLGENKELIYK